MTSIIKQGHAIMSKEFMTLPEISIDYAIAEKSRNAMLLPLLVYWNDIGYWDVIYEVLSKEDQDNVIIGDCMPVDCTNMLMFSSNRLVTGIGIKDILLV